MIEANVRGIPLWVHADEDLSNAIRRDGDFWEGNILDYIRDTFPVQKVVLDVGANIGNHTVYLATYLREFTKIIAFEPLQRNYDLLAQNIKRFNRDSVFAYHQGLSNEQEWVGIQANISNLGASEVTLDPEYTDERVFTNTIDQISSWFHPVTLIKIDVEWWESQVLEGAKNTLERDRPLVLIEDVRGEYGTLFPEGYEMIRAWDEHKTYLYGWSK